MEDVLANSDKGKALLGYECQHLFSLDRKDSCCTEPLHHGRSPIKASETHPLQAGRSGNFVQSDGRVQPNFSGTAHWETLSLAISLDCPG